MNSWRVLLAYLAARHGKRFRDRESLESFQRSMIRRHFAFLRKNSPHFSSIDPSTRLSDLPQMDKASMMEHFDRLNTRGVRKAEAFALAIDAETSRDFSPTLNGVTVGLSSGTSGNRGLFVVSPEEQSLWAGRLMAKLLPRHLLAGGHRLALFLRANSNLYESTRGGRVQFEFFDLLDPMNRHIDRLGAYDPTIIVAPASMWRLLAIAQREGRLKIQPEKIVSAAEVLEPQDRAFVEAAFTRPLHQIYQATEGFLGITCSHGVLHLNEDTLVVEREPIPGDRSRFIPIITDFRRRTQPIVRYRLNDILTPRETPCPCGSVLTAIERIEGRSDDAFRLTRADAPNEVGILFPDFVRRSIISASDQILEYRARQVGPNEVVIELRFDDTVDPARQSITRDLILRNLRAICDTTRLNPPLVRFDRYDWSNGPTKLRRVVNEWSAKGGRP